MPSSDLPRLGRRDFLAASTAVLPTFVRGQTPASPGGSRPNIILLLADDMGCHDPGCFGGTAVNTPHLDALAASGAKLTSFYAASAVCTPSRAAILTGRYPLRHDIRQHFTDDETHLPAHLDTIPKRLKAAGYATGHVGKWHLGGLHVEHAQNRAGSIPGPAQHGFDDYLCQIEQLEPRARMGRERTLFRQGGTCLLRNDQRVGPDDPLYPKHLTELIGDESLRLMQRYHQQRRPFFLNVWFLAPHTPYEPAPEPHWSRYKDDPVREDQRYFRSMVSCLDAQVGRIVAKLDELGLRDNTLILFTSDNGGAWEADNGPYKGGKTDLHEAGIRVPAIASWPGHIRPGQSLSGFAHHTDILPTICAAASLVTPAAAQVDGLNLIPWLTGQAGPPPRGTVFWQMDLYRSLQRHTKKPEPFVTEVARRGNWKLTARDGVPLELFDIAADPLETHNQLGQQEGLASELVGELREFLAAPRDRSGKVPVP
ncbi:MAG: sulfatase-like hydrolase/transferase [Bryobacterales bacterium]|nr:sulfatase-like hydrolase/transferase [Bryobacterales bacterium]